MADAADLKSAGGDSVWVRIPPALPPEESRTRRKARAGPLFCRLYGGQVLYNQAMNAQIDIPQAEIEAFCKRHHIRRLALFGSVLHDDFGPESDVDVLVEFEPGHTPGWAIVEIEDELSELLGRQAHIQTFDSVEADRNYLRREHILKTMKIVYVAE